ncbi:MAG: hypothetical protein H7A25_24615 [Leptospiraceae bacterium]|nr:hypothetical protein [Leptospiraceae bacterium]
MINDGYSYQEEYELEQKIRDLIESKLYSIQNTRSIIDGSKLDLLNLERNISNTFKETYLNYKKLKTLIKHEAFCDEEDDYSIILLGFISQIEYEFNNRFYLSLRDYSDIVLQSLELERKYKWRIEIEKCLSGHRPLTMGVLSMWIYGIEISVKAENDLKNCLFHLLGEDYVTNKYTDIYKFTSKYRIVRNNIAHNSRIIFYNEYTKFCLNLIGRERFFQWIKDLIYKGIFGDYLSVISNCNQSYKGKKIW